MSRMTELVAYAMKFIGLVLVGLRISWLLIEDKVLNRPRNAIVEWANRRAHPQLSLFVRCPFCIGLWAQAVLVAAAAQYVDLPLPVLWVAAVNMVAAPLHHLIDRALMG